jgi:hypothetical protein
MTQPESPSRLVHDFERTGAIHLRGVLDAQEVSDLRTEIHRAFESLDRDADLQVVRALSAAMVFRIESAMRTIVHPRIIAALKAILEPGYQVIPDFNIHRNLYDFTDTSRSITHLFGLIGSGWHHDAGSEGAKAYLYDRRYRMVKCGIYLQNNTLALGGGIVVAPLGHKLPLRSGSARLNYVTQRLWQNFRILTGEHTLDIGAGDFVAFDAHLPHRGALPQELLPQLGEEERRTGCVRLPDAKAKLVIYFNASRSALANTYMRHSLTRAHRELDALRNGSGHETFFSDFAGLRYPQDYPPAFVEALAANHIGVAQLSGQDLEDALAVRHATFQQAALLNYRAAEPCLV